jgi:quercetin dioxygenase-like cupin family protein
MRASELAQRRLLLRAVMENVSSTARVEIVEVRLAPGLRSPLHRHPCPVVGYIANGTVRFQVEGRPATLLNRGDAFYEPAGEGIAHLDNASTTEFAAFIAFYLLGSGREDLIEILE